MAWNWRRRADNWNGEEPPIDAFDALDGVISAGTCGYAAFRDGRLVRLLEGNRPASPLAEFIHGQFRALALAPQFPCVGGRSAVRRGTYRFALYAELGSDATSPSLLRDLGAFVAERPTEGDELTTFVACFVGPVPESEERFRALVDTQLRGLLDIDSAPWDPTVSSDPDDPRYAYSFAGCAFTIVPLSATSPRWARRFAWPTVVFNAERVFLQLRQDGELDRFRHVIRARDVDLQGGVNPEVLAAAGQTPVP